MALGRAYRRDLSRSATDAGASHRYVYHRNGGRAWHGPRIGQAARRSLAHQARCQARHFVRGEGHGHFGQLRGPSITSLRRLSRRQLPSTLPARIVLAGQGAGPGLEIKFLSPREFGAVKGIVLGKVL